MKSIFLLLLLLPSVALADEWTEADTGREAVFLALDTVDWAQTRNIARNLYDVHEQNSVLGDHPNLQQVNRYFAITAIAHIGIAYALPSEWRAAFQYVSIGVELDCTLHNRKVNISTKF